MEKALSLRHFLNLPYIKYWAAKYINITTQKQLMGNVLPIHEKDLPFFLSSGLPFFTVATNMSPTPAAGKRLRRPLTP